MKQSEFPTATPGANDYFSFVKDPGTTPTNNNVTLANLGTAITPHISGTGGVQWSQVVNESGASIANFDPYTGNGSWSSNGSVIQQTGVVGNWSYCSVKHSVAEPRNWSIWEAEMRLNTGSAVGLQIGRGDVVGQTPGYKAFIVFLDKNTDRIRSGVLGGQFPYYEVGNYSFSTTTSTWYKLRIVKLAHCFEIYFNGTFWGTVDVDDTTDNGQWDGAFVLSCVDGCQYRNIKAWNVDSTWLNYPA